VAVAPAGQPVAGVQGSHEAMGSQIAAAIKMEDRVNRQENKEPSPVRPAEPPPYVLPEHLRLPEPPPSWARKDPTAAPTEQMRVFSAEDWKEELARLNKGAQSSTGS